MRLLVATSNPHKLAEIEKLLRPWGVEVVSPLGLGYCGRFPSEPGSSFRRNSTIKALWFFRAFGLPTLADDSGLVIDALGGEPGVHSARYMGIDDPRQRLMAVLEKMKGVPWEERTARFVTVATFITPTGRVCHFTGVTEGYITFEPVGESGFGYDPIFYHPPSGRTYAQMSAEEKNAVSHRGKALRAFVSYLSGIMVKKR